MIKTVYQKSIYHSKVNLEVCKKARELILQKQESFTEKSWQCKIRTSKNVSFNILTSVELHELKMNIISHIENSMFLRGFYIRGFIEESWVNIYEKDFFQEFHDHTNPIFKYLSGVIYFSENNSGIVFDPHGQTIIPEFADIVIFPDDLLHRVIPNENEELRISLAFNFRLCKEEKITKLS